MQPETIVAWFCPGEDFDHGFVYSYSEEQQVAQVRHYSVMAVAIRAYIRKLGFRELRADR
jgi:hypothetical protein